MGRGRGSGEGADDLVVEALVEAGVVGQAGEDGFLDARLLVAAEDLDDALGGPMARSRSRSSGVMPPP